VPVAEEVNVHLDIDDDGDDATTTHLTLPFLLPSPIQERKPKYRGYLRNIIWEERVAKCRHVEYDIETYKMTESSFYKLLDCLAQD
jgi:hypothetical protein